MVCTIGRRDGQVGIAFDHVRGGHHLVVAPYQAAARHAAPTVHGDDRLTDALDGVRELVATGRQDTGR